MSDDPSTAGRPARFARLGGRAVGAALLLGVLLAALPLENIGGDFICFWSAGRLLGRGQDPYDGALQAALQRPLGWDAASSGIGLYEFMPYYYPPWLTLVCVPFGALPFTVGKGLWLYSTIWLLLASGEKLARILELPTKGQLALTALTLLFAMSVLSILFAQTSPLVLYLVVTLWAALRDGKDRLGGFVLAWVTIKPQLSAVLVAACLLWAWRGRRKDVIVWFVGTLLVLIALSTLLQPGWVTSFLQATRKNPVLTETYPWLGSTWMLALRVAGVEGIPLRLLYLLGVVPVLVWAWRGTRPSAEVASWLAPSLLGAFVVTPYAQPYDFVVLLPVVGWLAYRRLDPSRANLFLLATLSLPYVHLAFGDVVQRWIWVTPPTLPPRVLFLWFPAALLLGWGMTRERGRTEASASSLR